MARNHKFFFDNDRIPRARGPAAETVLMTFLETDVQGSDHICHDLMDDLIAIEDGSDDEREFIGNAHSVTLNKDGATISALHADGDGDASDSEAQQEAKSPADAAAIAGAVDKVAAAKAVPYHTGLKHFREILEDWEAFILDDGLDDESLDDDFD